MDFAFEEEEGEAGADMGRICECGGSEFVTSLQVLRVSEAAVERSKVSKARYSQTRNEALKLE